MSAPYREDGYLASAHGMRSPHSSLTGLQCRVGAGAGRSSGPRRVAWRVPHPPQTLRSQLQRRRHAGGPDREQRGSLRATLSYAGIPQAVASYDAWGMPETPSIGSFGFTGELQQGSDVWLQVGTEG